jgi:hypothetical protein
MQRTLANGGGPDDEGAVCNGFGNAFIFDGICHEICRANGRTRLPECGLIRIHQPQLREAKIAHSASGSADIERVPGGYQDHAQTAEFESFGQDFDSINLRREGFSI